MPTCIVSPILDIVSVRVLSRSTRVPNFSPVASACGQKVTAVKSYVSLLSNSANYVLPNRRKRWKLNLREWQTHSSVEEICLNCDIAGEDLRLQIKNKSKVTRHELTTLLSRMLWCVRWKYVSICRFRRMHVHVCIYCVLLCICIHIHIYIMRGNLLQYFMHSW